MHARSHAGLTSLSLLQVARWWQSRGLDTEGAVRVQGIMDWLKAISRIVGDTVPRVRKDRQELIEQVCSRQCS